MTHLDLFSGIGGFTLAAQWAGFETIGFSEVDPYCCKILKQHWPNVKNYGDIKTADFSSIGNVDLLTGGFPCQPFSVAGRRKGKEDNRYLWPEMCRVITQVKPTFILGENVTGIIRMELDNVLSDLEDIGYTTWPIVIPACAVDARHQRKRVWIMGYSQHSRQLATKEQGGSSKGIYKSSAREVKTSQSSRSSIEHEDVANTKSQQGRRIQLSEVSAYFSNGSDRSGKASCWPVEPSICRVAHGIPNRSHRLKALGNSIVPQVAYKILKHLQTNQEPPHERG